MGYDMVTASHEIMEEIALLTLRMAEFHHRLDNFGLHAVSGFQP